MVIQFVKTTTSNPWYFPISHILSCDHIVSKQQQTNIDTNKASSAKHYEVQLQFRNHKVMPLSVKCCTAFTNPN